MLIQPVLTYQAILKQTERPVNKLASYYRVCVDPASFEAVQPAGFEAVHYLSQQLWIGLAYFKAGWPASEWAGLQIGRNIQYIHNTDHVHEPCVNGISSGLSKAEQTLQEGYEHDDFAQPY